MVDFRDMLMVGLLASTTTGFYLAFLSNDRWKSYSDQLEERLKKYETSVLITSETLPDYEFHPRLSALKTSDLTPRKETLSKISFDAEGSSSLEQVLRNIVNIIVFNSQEPVNLPLIWGQEKDVSVYNFGRGQGLMVSDQGHMITAAQVIIDKDDRFQNWNSFAVISEDKKVYEVEEILALSEKYDLALVKTSYRPEHFVPPSFLTSQKAKETYTLVGIKMSGELHFTMTKQGLVSLKNPAEIALVDYYSHGVFEAVESQLQRYDNSLHLFTDMLILDQYSQPGFSGSVVADKRGRIIGLVSGKRERDRGENQAIVAKSSRVKELIDHYLTYLEEKIRKDK